MGSGQERSAKRLRTTTSPSAPSSRQPPGAAEIFGSGTGGCRLFLGARTASTEWRIENFSAQRLRADGACLDGPKFGVREPWQVFCHPDGRCFNQPQGGPPGVFLRYLGQHERVPAYATIETLVDGEFRVPENNTRDAPFVVLFGRNEIEEWGVCKDFGLFDDAFGRGLTPDGSLLLRARVTWIEPRADNLLPREVISVRQNADPIFPGAEGSLQADLAALWSARRPSICAAGPSGGPAASAVGSTTLAVAGDLMLVCEGQRFEVDRAIVAARSSYFGAMLSGFREAGQKEVNFGDISARAMGSVIRFIYTDEGPEISTCEEAEELLVVSSRLGVPGVLRVCADYLRDNFLTVTTAVSLLRLADEHGVASLREEALAVLGANFDQVKVSPEWDELLRSGMNPALINDTVQAVQNASIFVGRASIKL